ncbi:hypothetical protein DLAC_11369 [Tieghemostelium lacteum]|uniref:TraB family protein n=1 Tax=Tieghemostelium lacteum TaxID=361077 RepID=A0A151Z3V4_TIELA|nr:hypothetical protein DLAC_11369 [Tieghemostelium lacteum]|eukprot:KYQ88625.1 hypothetical protein DLAC_11369 [Tieghemostelium lacteum]
MLKLNLTKPINIFLQSRYLRYYSSSSKELHTQVNDDPIYFLRESTKDIFIIGTSHISKNSALSVQKLIQDVKPDTVVLELCQNRFEKMKTEENSKNLEIHNPRSSVQSLMEDIINMFRTQQLTSGNLLQSLLKRFYNQFRLLGIIPGLEFKLAIREAEKLNANIVLGDLPISQTMNGLMKNLTELVPLLKNPSNMTMNRDLIRLEEMMKPLSHVLSRDPLDTDDLEKEFKILLTNKNLREMRSIIKKTVPGIYDSFLFNRECHIARSIKSSNGNRIVVVVGAMHCEGLKELLEKDLTSIPVISKSDINPNLPIQFNMDLFSKFKNLFK